jgi:glycosyltransferase involved in cell wall biosynthesis
MSSRPYPTLVMLGAAAETRGSIAAVVDAYRTHGLFSRWPIEYVVTHCAGFASRRASMWAKALGRFGVLLAQHRRLVLHVHTAPHVSFWRHSAFIGAALAARCPTILHLHGSDFDRFYDASSAPGRAAIGYFLEQAACVAVPSQRLAAWVRSAAPHARTRVLPHPVPIPALQDAPRPRLVVFLGKLEAYKGIFELLEAVARLRASVPDVRLVCAGDGKRVAVARYAERLGIADAVKFTGWVGPSGKRALLESAAAFALPSYAEGMPVSLLEAMAAGVPVVASPVGGVPEVVVDGVSGFLCAPGDVSTLQRLLGRLLTDGALAAKIGAAGRETARLRFAPERALPRLEELYADIGLQALSESARPVEGELRKAA